MTNNKQIIYDTRDKMPYEKLSNATHRKVFFYNLKKSLLIYHSDVKAAIRQNEHIILYIEKKTFRKHFNSPLCNLQEDFHHSVGQCLVLSFNHCFMFPSPFSSRKVQTVQTSF